jgi:hypothetical protein
MGRLWRSKNEVDALREARPDPFRAEMREQFLDHA